MHTIDDDELEMAYPQKEVILLDMEFAMGK